MSDAMSRDDLVIAVNRLMICAMEDIDCGRDEAGPTTLDLVGRIEAHDAALRAQVARLREALRPFAEVADCLDRYDGDRGLVLLWREGRRLVDITTGDLRRARAALSGDAPEKGVARD